MADIYVECGKMTYDEKKGPKEYAAKGVEKLRSGAAKGIAKAKGFTTKKPAGKSEGYVVNLDVSEVTVDDKGTSCKVTGEVITWPKHVIVKITGSGKVPGDKSEGAVMDCIEAAASAALANNLPKI